MASLNKGVTAEEAVAIAIKVLEVNERIPFNIHVF